MKTNFTYKIKCIIIIKYECINSTNSHSLTLFALLCICLQGDNSCKSEANDMYIFYWALLKQQKGCLKHLLPLWRTIRYRDNYTLWKHFFFKYCAHLEELHLYNIYKILCTLYNYALWRESILILWSVLLNFCAHLFFTYLFIYFFAYDFSSNSFIAHTDTGFVLIIARIDMSGVI